MSEHVDSNELITLDAHDRNFAGKSHARKIRKKGFVPAILLKKGTSRLLKIESKWVSKIWKSNKKFNLNIDGEIKLVIIHELQIDAAKRTLLHLDLMLA